MAGSKGLLKRLCAALALALYLGAIMPSAVLGGASRPGTIDRSFGHGGTVFTKAPPGIANSGFGSAEVDSDGNLVLELTREAPEKDEKLREVERRLPDGKLDLSFGRNGRVRVGRGDGLALRPGGSIVVATDSCGAEHGSFVLLDRSGNRITDFGKEGCGPRIGFSTPHIAVASDGSIYAAGAAPYCPCSPKGVTPSEPAIARLLPDGGLDPGFGKDGIVHLRADLNIPSGELESRQTNGIVPTADGGIALTAGGLLVKLEANGALAPSFGKGGEVNLDHFSEALTQLPDGKLVVVAAASEYSFQKPAQMVVARFLPDGTPDPSFGIGGKLEPPRLAEAEVVDLAPAPGGAVLMAGQIDPRGRCAESCHSILFVGRVGPDGQLDPAYGSQGLVELPAPEIPEAGVLTRLSALAVSANGAAVIAGDKYSTAAFAFAINPAGALDQGFDKDGALVERFLKPPSLEPTGIALGPKGRINLAVEGEASESGYGDFLMTFRYNGRQARGASGGVTPTAARGEIIPVRGGFVSKREQTETRSELVAVGRDGRALTRYGEKGIVELPRGFEPRAIEAGPGGGAIALGSVDEGQKMAIYRVGPMGRPVRGFGDRGLVRLDFGRDGATAFAATSMEGRLVVTGWAGGHTGVAKLLPDGRLDRRFGRGGVVRGLLGKGDYGTQIASLSGGVVIGATAEFGPPQFSRMVRLNRRGHVVRSFGDEGTLQPRVDGRLLGLFTYRGRIVVVSDNEYARRSPGGVELRAYRSNGSPALGYGHRGLATGGIGQRRFFHPVATTQQPDGRIVVAGAAWSGEQSQVELMRFR